MVKYEAVGPGSEICSPSSFSFIYIRVNGACITCMHVILNSLELSLDLAGFFLKEPQS